MSKLTNIPQVNQKYLKKMYSIAVKTGQNILVLGPSGAGKTDMAFQAAEEAGFEAKYWNMSTMERPDIQGIPVISDDKQTVRFASQEGLPFKRLAHTKDENLIVNALKEIENLADKDNASAFKTALEEELTRIRNNKAVCTLQRVSHLVPSNLFSNYKPDEGKKFVLLLDEIDKTPPENLQPLLELLLYKTINGEPLNIQAVFMTGNLPDEQTYGEPLSHALTNRVMTFELCPDINIWLNWGIENNLHPLILGFLSKKENAAEFFNKRPKSNDMYSYAYPSPRSWTRASNAIKKFEEITKDDRMISEESEQSKLRKMIIGSIIGEEASERLDVWFNFYRQYDPLIEDVFNGKNIKHPKEIDALFVICISLMRKFLHFARNNNTKDVQSKAKHIFKWISNENVSADIRVCAFRSSFDLPLFIKHGIESLPEAAKSFKEVTDMIDLISGKELTS